MKASMPAANAVELFWKLVTAIIVTCFSLMLIIMMIQVVSRYALGVAVPWTDEASRYFFLAEIFLGAALAQRHGEHISITILTDMLSEDTKRYFDAASDIICIVIAGMLLFGALDMMERTAGVYASTFRLSFSYVYMVQFIGILLMMLLFARDLYAKLFRRTRPAFDPEQE